MTKIHCPQERAIIVIFVSDFYSILLLYGGEDMQIAYVTVFYFVIYGVCVRFKVIAGRLRQLLHFQSGDDGGGDGFNCRLLFHRGSVIAGAAEQQGGEQLCGALFSVKLPQGAKAPLVIRCILPVQEKDHFERCFDEFHAGKLRPFRLPMLQAARKIVLPGLCHEEEIPGKALQQAEPSVLTT